MATYIKIAGKTHKMSDSALAEELARSGMFVRSMSFGGKYPADVFEMHPSARMNADTFARVMMAVLPG